MLKSKSDKKFEPGTLTYTDSKPNFLGKYTRIYDITVITHVHIYIYLGSKRASKRLAKDYHYHAS